MIRRMEVTDLASVLELNQRCVPEVGPLDEVGLAALLRFSPWSRVVEIEGEIVGMLIGLVEGVEYASPNYRWFGERHGSFAYVDRIALAPEARGAGHGLALYEAFQDWAVDSSRPVLCAEVNLDPPNERSLRFHRTYGFEQVGEQLAYERFTVAMLEKRLPTPPPEPAPAP